MAGDANYASVSLLLHCDGTNGSTTFTDSSATPKTVTANGNAQISTAQSKWGVSSVYLDGNGDYLSVAHDNALNLIAGDWTIEAWVYVAALPASATMEIVNKDGVAGTSYSQYSFFITSAGKLSTFLGNGNGVSPTGTTYTGTTTITTGTWHHVALVKSGSTCLGFLDGNQEWSAASATMYDGSKALRIGYQSGQPSTSYFNGYIDDIRITKGVARYTGTFTPPAAAFDDRLPQVSGNVKDASGANAARTVRAYRRDTGALVGSTTSNGTTGNYTIDCTTAEEVTVVAFDNATSGTYYNDQAARVIPA